MKKSLLLMFALVASVTMTFAQTNLASGKTPVILKNNTGNTYTTDQLNKITDGQTGTTDEYGVDIAKKENLIDIFYIDLGAAHQISAFESTFTGLRPNNLYIYGTNTTPSSETSFDTTPDGYTELYGAGYASDGGDNTPYTKSLTCADASNSFQYIVVVPKGFPYDCIRIQEFKVFQYETPVLTSISATAAKTTLTVGETSQIAATPTDQFGASIGATVTYSSSVPSVATVSEAGLIEAVAAGTTTITVKASEEIKTTINITVNAVSVPPTSVPEAPAAGDNVVCVFSNGEAASISEFSQEAWDGAAFDKLYEINGKTVAHAKTVGNFIIGRNNETVFPNRTTANYIYYDASNKGMKKLHIDLYSNSDASGYIQLEESGVDNKAFSLDANTWKSVEIDLSSMGTDKKIKCIDVKSDSKTLDVYVANIYFSKDEATTPFEIVNVNGIASVTGTLDNTQVSAFANSKYSSVVAFDLTAATLGTTVGTITPANSNAIFILAKGDNVADEVVAKFGDTKNLCFLKGNTWLVFPTVNSSSQTVTLNDGQYLLTDYVFANDNGTTYSYSRSLSNGQVASFIFPAEVEIPANVTAYTLSAYNSETKVISFAEVQGTALASNTPYILVANADAEISFSKSVSLDMKTVGSTNASPLTLQGTYKTLQGDGTQYVLKAGATATDDKVTFFKTSSSAIIDPFRCYLTGVPAGARIRLVDNEETGIKSVDTVKAGGAYYTLGGQRVAQPRKGLYVQDGKKVIVK